MKAFPSEFTAAKNALSGQEPIWILKLVAGGVTYYLSDNAFSIGPWAVTTKGWVKSWGRLQEGISGTLDEFRISDFSLDVLSSPDESPDMETLATTYALESSEVSLYLWFYGCVDPPQEMFRGYVKDITIPDEFVVQLNLQDESLRLERAMIGTKVDRTTYPKADPDDVGKVIPIPFGTVSRLRALALNAGIMTSLPASISGTATSFKVSDTTGFYVGMVIWADQEKMLVNSVNSGSVDVTRGHGGTAAVVHDKATILWEDRSEFVYVAADFPVTSIPKVWGAVGQTTIDITSICTRYPFGNHSDYPGKAVVTIPGYVTAEQAVALGADPSNFSISLSGATVASIICLSDPGHTHVTGQSTSELTSTSLPTNTNWTGAGGLGYTATISYGGSYPYWFYWTLNFPADGARTSCTYSISITVTVNPGYSQYCGIHMGVYSGGRFVSVYFYDFGLVTGTRTLTFTHDLGSQAYNTVYVGMETSPNSYLQVTAASRSIMLTGLQSGASSANLSKTGTGQAFATKGGSIEISGNSVANTLVGDGIFCDVVSPVATREDAFNWLLFSANVPVNLQTLGIWPDAYSFNGAITEYKSALYWLNTLAFQCRAWFKLGRGVAQLIFRDSVLMPVKTLSTCRISGGKKVHSRRKTNYDEVLNTIHVLYARDWSQNKSDTAYAAVATGSDPSSIATYGPRERAELFQFDFVTSPTMAADLLAFYLDWYKDRHWLHEFDTFLYDAELEFGDVVTLGFTGNQIGQILESQDAPGDSNKSDTIGLVVVV